MTKNKYAKVVTKANTEPEQTPTQASRQSIQNAIETFEDFQENLYKPNPKIKEILKLRLFPLRLTGVTSRVFNLWKEEGIVEYPEPPENKNREKVMLTIPEYIWVRLVYCLRLFNVRNNIVLSLKEGLFSSITKEEYLNGAEETKIPIDDFLPTVEEGGAISHMFLAILKLKISIDILVYPTGEMHAIYDKDFSLLPAKFKGAPIKMELSFSTLVVELIERMYEINKGQEFGLLTEHEIEILDIMNSGKAESLEIQLENGQPISYIWKEKGLLAEEDIHNVINDFKTNHYGAILLKTNNNKSIFYEAQHKKKF